MEVFLSLWRLSSAFMHQMQRSLLCTLPVSDRCVLYQILHWIFADPIFHHDWDSYPPYLLHFLSPFFFAYSKDLLLNSFILQLECPKVPRPHQILVFYFRLFCPAWLDLHSSRHSSFQRGQKEVSLFLFPLRNGSDIFSHTLLFYIWNTLKK